MTKTVAPSPVDLDDEIFSADAYRLNIPTLDGRKATKISLRFSGSGILDRTSEDDLALLEAMRLARKCGSSSLARARARLSDSGVATRRNSPTRARSAC
jgi:hypothetical protein